MYMNCEECGVAVQSNSYNSHMFRRHKLSGNFYMQCKWCEKKISTKHYYQHAMRKHFYGKFICEKCTFCDFSAKGLVDHIRESHKDEFAWCPCCDKEVLLNHLESHYRSCILSKLKPGKEVCAKCGETFGSKGGLNIHIKSHKRKELAKEGKEDNSLYYFCDQCDKKYSQMKYLKLHIQSVHEKLQFNCSICNMAFDQARKLKNHNAQVHSTDKRLECKVCGVRKPDEWHLRLHERSHEDAQFQCSFCSKRLKSQESLTAHERQHTGEKPFKCPICSVAFVSKHALAQHTKGAHKIEGPRGGKTGWKFAKNKLN